MTIVVPFDDSHLSREALRRATEIKRQSESVVALVVIPNDNAKYARNRDWLDPHEAFDQETIVSRLSDTVTEIGADCSFEYVVVGRYAQSGQIASEIRNYAEKEGARMVAIGSDNAGRIVSSVGDIGPQVATAKTFDILIVRSETTRNEAV